MKPASPLQKCIGNSHRWIFGIPNWAASGPTWCSDIHFAKTWAFYAKMGSEISWDASKQGDHCKPGLHTNGLKTMCGVKYTWVRHEKQNRTWTLLMGHQRSVKKPKPWLMGKVHEVRWPVGRLDIVQKIKTPTRIPTCPHHHRQVSQASEIF